MLNQTRKDLPWDLSGEASQVADGGGEESGAELAFVGLKSSDTEAYLGLALIF